MKTGQMALRGAAGVGFAAWAAVAFWTFNFNVEDSLFLDSVRPRLLPFLAAFLGALALPFTALRFWREAAKGRFTALGACLCQVACAGACVVPLAAASALLCRASGPWRLAGDDAMSVGVDLIVLALMAAGSVVGLAAAFLLRHAWHGGLDSGRSRSPLRSLAAQDARRIGPLR